MKIFLSLLLVICTILGILDAGFITYEKLIGSIPPCTVHFQCGEVLRSKWSSIGPAPLSALGVAFYTTFFIVGALFFLEKNPLQFFAQKIPTERILLSLGVFGGGFSLYLVFVMSVLLHAWCFYCLLSAGNCLILLLLSSVLYFITKKESQNAVHI